MQNSSASSVAVKLAYHRLHTVSKSSKVKPMIQIVLVQPKGPLNIGAVARTMKNFDLSELVLVAPQCDPFDTQALDMSVHAEDLLRRCSLFDSLPEALQDCVAVVGTTARVRTVPAPLEPPETGLSWLAKQRHLGPVALVFGPEDRGLSNEELALCQRFIYIPTSQNYPSMNLAQAVAVCAYVLSQQTRQELTSGVTLLPPAPAGETERFYQHFQEALLEVGYLQPHTSKRKMEKFRRLFNRAALTSEEVALLRGVLRQMIWNVHKESPKQNPPLREDSV
jgi:tRNA/rRNA methyltransferase